MTASTKNPLHPSALRLNDIQPGRRIICFNLNNGIQGEFIVVRRPEVRFVGLGHTRKKLVVALRSVRYGVEQYMSLGDMGIIPYSSGWNTVNFTVDSKKRKLLPDAKQAHAGSLCKWEDMIDRWERDYEDELERELYINSLW